jgi:hypothetical protein
MKKKTYKEIEKAIITQKKLCDKLGLPHFAPPNGICSECKRQIYQNYNDSSGVNGSSLVTGCPHCLKSYCD